MNPSGSVRRHTWVSTVWRESLQVAEQVKNFAVQLDGQLGQIFTGQVDASGSELLSNKEDVTDNAVLAVAEYVLRSFDGALEIDYDDGITYQIQVVKIGQPQHDGSRYGLHPGGMIVGYQASPDTDT